MAKKLLGIDTDLWALLTTNGHLRGGDSRPRIYWTRAMAKFEQRAFPDCEIAAVRIVVQPKTRAATKPRKRSER